MFNQSLSTIDSLQHLFPYLIDRTEEDVPGRRTNRTKGNRHRNCGYALNEVQHLSDHEFQKMFRTSRAKFEVLNSLIADY